MDDRQIIHEFLKSLVNRPVAVGDDDSLLAAKLIDSLKVAELIVFLETQFEITFESADLTPANFDSVNAMVRLLTHKKNGVCST